MKTTVLIFPDNSRMSDFIMDFEVGYVQANSNQQTLTGTLNKDQIAIACTIYQAQLKPDIAGYR